ncbi:MAG: XRE family transcriptional regulator [Chloroflexales bacterium]|nr:XRE family transcriptional regulator [Chloroflexales bacterium]
MRVENSFGRQVQRRRQLLDISAAGLAAQAGISVHTLRKIERDERRPSREVAALLADALKIAPAAREQFLRAARGQTGAAQPGEPAAAPASPARVALTPSPVLIGRSREQQQLTGLLARPDCRLLTLLGPGGIGKSALALAVAQTQADLLPDGATLVALAGVGAGAMVPLALAHALGLILSGFRPPIPQLCEELRERALLLVLDNAEHLLAQEADAAPLTELVGALLGAAPELKLLVTSRTALAVQDEWVFEVPGLALSRSASGSDVAQEESAAELFVARAQRTRPGFAPTPGEAEAISAICAAVGGAPLGIELAASWLRALTPCEIAAHMTRDIGALQSPHRDTPARHRSLRAVFNESWRLLGDAERAALGQLSVFHGGWTSPAAETVAGATLPILESLVAQSLVRRGDAVDGRSSRYELHELIRQFAAEQLQTDADAQRAARDRHAAYHLRALQDAGSWLKSHRQLEAVSALKPDLDNLWAAFEWAIASGQFDLIGLDWSARFIFVQILGVFPQAAMIGARLIAALEAALEAGGALELLAACSSAHSWQAINVFRLGQIGRMVQHAQHAVTLSDSFDEAMVKFPAHLAAGLAYTITGEYARALWHNEQMVLHAAATHDAWSGACAASQLGASLMLLGRLDEAYATLAGAISQLRSLGEASMYGITIWYMLSVRLALEHLDEADTLALEGIAALERIGDRHYRGMLHDQLGLIYMWRGDVASALAEHQRAQHLLEQIGSVRDSQIAAMRAGYALARSGQPSAGIAQIRASLGWFWEAQSLPNALDALALLADTLQTQTDADPLPLMQWLALVQAHPATLPEMRVWAQRKLHAGIALLPPAHVAAIQATSPTPSLAALMRELVT